MPREVQRDRVGPGRQRRPDGQLHGLLQPERLRLRRPGSTDENAPTLTYSWNFGNGRTGSGSVPSHTYTSANTYTVTLTVRDEYGLTGTTTRHGDHHRAGRQRGPDPGDQPAGLHRAGLQPQRRGVGRPRTPATPSPTCGTSVTAPPTSTSLGHVAHLPGGRHLDGDPHRHRRLGQGGQHHPAGDGHPPPRRNRRHACSSAPASRPGGRRRGVRRRSRADSGAWPRPPGGRGGAGSVPAPSSAWPSSATCPKRSQPAAASS